MLLPSLKSDSAYVLDARVAGFMEGGGSHPTVVVSSLLFRVPRTAPEARTVVVPVAADTGSGEELALNWTVASSGESAAVVMPVKGGACLAVNAWLVI